MDTDLGCHLGCSDTWSFFCRAHKCPVLPSLSPEKPSVFSQELKDATVMEGEDLTLVCETTVLDSPVHWTKDGQALRASARCQLSREGHRAQLVITDTTLQDSGRYKCEAGGAWSSSIVRVHGEPPAALVAHVFFLAQGWGGSGPHPAPSLLAFALLVSVCVCWAGVIHPALSIWSLCSSSLSLLLPVSGSLLLRDPPLALCWSPDWHSPLYLIPDFVLCSNISVSPSCWLGPSPSASVSLS